VAAGYSRDQVKDAKHRIGAVAQRHGFQEGAQWTWQLPTNASSYVPFEGRVFLRREGHPLRILPSNKNPPFEAADDRIHKVYATVRAAMIRKFANLRSQLFQRMRKGMSPRSIGED